MPEQLKSDEVNSKTDPSVAKQWDETTPMHQQFEELYGTIEVLMTDVELHQLTFIF